MIYQHAPYVYLHSPLHKFKENNMINLTESTRAKDLTELYFENKMRIDSLTEQNKEILETLVKLSDGQPAKIGTRKLTLTERKGSVSYATIVKEHMPLFDLEPYRGGPTKFWKLS